MGYLRILEALTRTQGAVQLAGIGRLCSRQHLLRRARTEMEAAEAVAWAGPGEWRDGENGGKSARLGFLQPGQSSLCRYVHPVRDLALTSRWSRRRVARADSLRSIATLCPGGAGFMMSDVNVYTS